MAWKESFTTEEAELIQIRKLLTTSLDIKVSCMDFWSISQEELSVPAVAASQSLPDVTVALPSGATVVRAVAMLKFRAIENTNGSANKLSGAQYIQARDDTPGAWSNAITLVDDQFGLAASTREGGDAIIGDIDIKAVVDGDDTYNLRWASALADLAAIQLNDVQVGLRIWFK